MITELLNIAAQLDPRVRILAVILGSAVLGLLIRWVVVNFVFTYSAWFSKSLSSSLIYRLGTRLKFFFPLLVLFFALPLLQLEDNVQNLLGKIIGAFLVIIIGWLLVKLLSVAEDVIFDQYNVKKREHYKERRIRTQILFLKKVVSIIVWVIVISAILLSFDEAKELGATLITSAGVAGIIIGVAAQKSLANFIAGIQIAVTQPIKIEDVVVVENEWGMVEEITLTYVVVQIWDRRRIILPITYFTEKPFQNWTRTSSDLIGKVYIYTDYNIPVDEVRNELFNIVEGSALWDRKICGLQVTDSTDRSLELRALVSGENSGNLWDLRCLVREKLVAFIQNNYPDSLPKTRAELFNVNQNNNNLFPPYEENGNSSENAVVNSPSY